MSFSFCKSAHTQFADRFSASDHHRLCAGQMDVKGRRASDLQETLIEGRFLLPILGTGNFVRTWN